MIHGLELSLSIWCGLIAVGIIYQRRDRETRSSLEYAHIFNTLIIMGRIVINVIEYKHLWNFSWKDEYYLFQTCTILMSWMLIIMVLSHSFVYKQVQSKLQHPFRKYLAGVFGSLVVLGLHKVAIILKLLPLQITEIALFIGASTILAFYWGKVRYAMYLYMHPKTKVIQIDGKIKSIYRKLPWGDFSLFIIFAESICWYWFPRYLHWMDPLVFATYAKLMQGNLAVEESMRNLVARSRSSFSQQIIFIDIETGQPVVAETSAAAPIPDKRMSFMNPHGGAITEDSAKVISSNRLRQSIIRPSVHHKSLNILTPPPSPMVSQHRRSPYILCSPAPSPISTPPSSPILTNDMKHPDPRTQAAPVLMIRGHIGPNIQRLIDELKQDNTHSRFPDTVPELQPLPELEQLPEIEESLLDIEEAVDIDIPPKVYMTQNLLGCPESWKELFIFPNPIQTLNSRLHAMLNTCLVVTTLALQLYLKDTKAVNILLIYQAYHFSSFSLAGPRLNVQSLFIHYCLQPYITCMDRQKLTAGAPKRFGQILNCGLIFAALVTHYFKFKSSSNICLITLLISESVEWLYDMCFPSLLFYSILQWIPCSADQWFTVFATSPS